MTDDHARPIPQGSRPEPPVDDVYVVDTRRTARRRADRCTGRRATGIRPTGSRARRRPPHRPTGG